MVFRDNIDDTYILDKDGGKTPASVTSPNNDNQYTRESLFAVVKDELFIFGGLWGRRKIAKFDRCAFVELSIQLDFDIRWLGAALAIENQSKALICFEYRYNGKSCALFDGTTIMSSFSTNYPHYAGSLGLYEGNPTTVGSLYSDGFRKVETLTSSGWSLLPDHPQNIKEHNLIGLETGALLLIGGYNSEDGALGKEIWKLEKGNWSVAGITEGIKMPSSIKIENYIFVVSGIGFNYEEYPIQRIEIEGNDIKDVKTIAEHPNDNSTPQLLHLDSSSDFCHPV